MASLAAIFFLRKGQVVLKLALHLFEWRPMANKALFSIFPPFLEVLQSILTAILAFASTNIDDIFILMLFFGLKKHKPSTIVFGQYLGISTLVAISLIGAFIGSFIDSRYIGLLGFFPIYLAIKQIIENIKENNEHDDELHVSETRLGILAVAGVTIANGGDNIGVYIPLFSTLDIQEKTITFIVFGTMIYLWCVAARYLAGHPLLASSLNKYAHVIMPIVLFALGIFILYESRSLTLLF